jgi:two-component system response regulator PilR (NtrC family)
MRVSADLNDLQVSVLEREGILDRYCRACGYSTQWLRVEEAAAAPAAAVSKLPARVLLIDDDPDILTIVGKALARHNLDTDTATSARDAIMRLARDDYDLILSDIRMPDFDGMQLLAFLDERMPEYKNRVIFLTGDTGTQDTADFLKRTGAPYLVKPIDLEALRGLIQRFLEQENRG